MAFSARNVFRNQNLREHEDPGLVNCLVRLRFGSDLIPASPLRGPPPHSPPSRLPASVSLTNGHPPSTNKDGLPEALETAAAVSRSFFSPRQGGRRQWALLPGSPPPLTPAPSDPCPRPPQGSILPGAAGREVWGGGVQYQAPPPDGRKKPRLKSDENPQETDPHAALLHLPLDWDILATSALRWTSPPCTGPAASRLRPHLARGCPQPRSETGEGGQKRPKETGCKTEEVGKRKPYLVSISLLPRAPALCFLTGIRRQTDRQTDTHTHTRAHTLELLGEPAAGNSSLNPDPWENLPALPSSCWVPPHLLSLTPSPFSSSFLSLSVYYFLWSC